MSEAAAESDTKKEQTTEQTSVTMPETTNPQSAPELGLYNVHEEFYNTYATKKTIAHGVMNGALLAGNGTQLKLLMQRPDHDYLWVISALIVVTSILAQIVLFVLLAILSEGHIADPSKRRRLNVINDIVLALTGIIFALNIVANILV